jgi:hypothetical protein
MRMPACYEEILEEKKRSCLAIFQRLISSTHVHGLVHRHLDGWALEKMIQMTGVQLRGSVDIGEDDSDDRRTVKRKFGHCRR